jgi:hypothetical protein
MRSLALLLALFGLLLLAPPSEAQRGKKKGKAAARKEETKSEFANVADLHAEVTVLNVLFTLQPTKAQMESIQKVSATTMQKPPPRKLVKVTERFKKTITDLRDALIEGDEEKIDELFGKLEEYRQKEDPDFEDIEITTAAREQAPLLLAQLSARQVAAYVASIPDFPDPVDRLLETMDESRKLRGKQWQSLRDDSAYQVGWLVAGLDSKAEEKVREKATALLDRAYKLNDKEYTTERAALEKEARALVGKLGPTDIIRHVLERVLAEILSSHRLEAVIQALKK